MELNSLSLFVYRMETPPDAQQNSLGSTVPKHSDKNSGKGEEDEKRETEKGEEEKIGLKRWWRGKEEKIWSLWVLKPYSSLSSRH